MLSDTEKAAEMAERAVPRLVRDAGTPLATEVLSLFATLRTQEIYRAVGAGDDLSATAIPDARAAHELLATAHTSTPERWRSYLDLLGTLGANGEQADALRRALRRHPTSGDLHAYLRFQVLRDEGARALEAVYEGDLFADVAPANRPLIDWYRGLAALVAAEQDVANRDAASALAAYRRAGARLRRLGVALREPGAGRHRAPADRRQRVRLRGRVRRRCGHRGPRERRGRRRPRPDADGDRARAPAQAAGGRAGRPGPGPPGAPLGGGAGAGDRGDGRGRFLSPACARAGAYARAR
jgi:hypothetical protein